MGVFSGFHTHFFQMLKHCATRTHEVWDRLYLLSISGEAFAGAAEFVAEFSGDEHFRFGDFAEGEDDVFNVLADGPRLEEEKPEDPKEYDPPAHESPRVAKV